MQMKWIVSGIWDHTNEPGSLIVNADSQPAAYAIAKARGLTATEAMSFGGPPAPATPAAKAAKRRDHPAAPDLPAPPPVPARSRADRFAERPSARTPATGLALTLVGVAVLVLGTFLREQLDPTSFGGEAVQFAGAVLVIFGLRILLS